MKAWIAVGALLMGLVVVAVRPAATHVVVRDRMVEVPVRVEVPVPAAPAAERVRVETRTLERPAAPPRPAPLPSGVVVAHDRMLFLFDRELELRPDQHQFMADVLAERQKDIEAYNQTVIASGVFRAGEYERRIRAIQSASYARMGDVLDAAQRSRFETLLAQGRIGDAVMFQVPPTLTVIQD